MDRHRKECSCRSYTFTFQVRRTLVEQQGIVLRIFFAPILRINPAGYTPALITPEGSAMHENAAMLFYLCERHDISDLMPMPGDPDRALFLSKFFYHTNDIQPPTKRWFYPHRFTTEGDAARDSIMQAAS